MQTTERAAPDIWSTAPVCGVCGSPGWTERFQVYTRRFVECESCGMIRLFDRVAPEHLGVLYGDYYPLSAQRPSKEQLSEELANPTFAYRLGRLSRHMSDAQPSMFELGAGDGNFLAFLRSRGWTAGGTEFTEKTAALVRSRHDIELMVGDLPDLVAGIGQRPLVGAYHVIEHVYEPRAWLKMVRQIIKPGGLLHLQTPNFGSFEFKSTGTSFAMLSFPQHVYLYTPSALQALLRSHGFSPIDLSTYDPWHSPQTVLGSFGNLTRYWLTGRLPWPSLGSPESDADGGRPAVPQSIARPRPAVAALRGILRPASVAVARLESMVGRGSVIDIIARAV